MKPSRRRLPFASLLVLLAACTALQAIAQEEAPATGPVGASKTPTWNDVLEKLHQLEARLTALERET